MSPWKGSGSSQNPSTAKQTSPEATFNFQEGGTVWQPAKYAHTIGLTDSENYGAAKKDEHTPITGLPYQS